MNEKLCNSNSDILSHFSNIALSHFSNIKDIRCVWEFSSWFSIKEGTVSKKRVVNEKGDPLFLRSKFQNDNDNQAFLLLLLLLLTVKQIFLTFETFWT